MGNDDLASRDEAPAIRVCGLTKRYAGVTAVDAIDFCVEAGSVTALLGGNGAGKTTTIAMIMGLLLPTSGRIEVLGHDMLTARYAVLARMNFESPYVEMPLRLSVRQNLEVFARLYGVRERAARIAELAHDLGLETFMDRAVGRLSAGQKTRVSLAKALVNEPELLLLDEPTASLDPDTADWVRGHIEAYRRRRGATILLALAQHGRGGASCRARADDEGRPDRRRRQPRGLVARYGRSSLEEVFLDIARGAHRPHAAAGGPH